MTTEQHTAQEKPTGAGAEQIIAQNREASPGIDPEKLLELAKSRHHDGGVTLGWPTVIKIVEELRQGRTAVEERDAWAHRVRFLNDQYSALLDKHDALAAHQADLVRELTACQNVLHSLAHSGDVTPDYADEAKVVLKRTKEASLARRDAKKHLEGGASFKEEMLAASGGVIHPHIEGVFAVWKRHQVQETTA